MPKTAAHQPVGAPAQFSGGSDWPLQEASLGTALGPADKQASVCAAATPDEPLHAFPRLTGEAGRPRTRPSAASPQPPEPSRSCRTLDRNHSARWARIAVGTTEEEEEEEDRRHRVLWGGEAGGMQQHCGGRENVREPSAISRARGKSKAWMERRKAIWWKRIFILLKVLPFLTI